MAATEEAACTSEPELVCKKGATSVVWSWFGFRPSDTRQNTIFCKICKRSVVAKGGNTTNLFHHLKQKHLLEYNKAVKAREEASASTDDVIFNNDLLKVKDNDTQLTKDIKTAILDYMNKSYKDSVTERLINMASLLDPRFRTEYLSESESEAIKVQAISELEPLVYQGSTAIGFKERPPHAVPSSSAVICGFGEFSLGVSRPQIEET
uniref:BED-type domain-containing protein n=1 Tax=Knipowitschia caucasica TaxID=637954 RepID=A0AAV2MBN1_KNICA